MLRSTSNESRGGKFHPLSLFLPSALRASYGQLRFPESSPFGRRPFERIGFQPTRHTIACLQFDHTQRLESTTDRFAQQLYGEFNCKYGQMIPLLPVAQSDDSLNSYVSLFHCQRPPPPQTKNPSRPSH